MITFEFTHPHSTESSSGVFTLDLANVVEMLSLDKYCQQESLHLFGFGNEIVERLQQVLHLLDPWVGPAIKKVKIS